MDSGMDSVIARMDIGMDNDTRVTTTHDCPRCHGRGWACEAHRTQPMDHPTSTGEECDGAGCPCEEPGCPFRMYPTDAEVAKSGRG